MYVPPNSPKFKLNIKVFSQTGWSTYSLQKTLGYLARLDGILSLQKTLGYLARLDGKLTVYRKH